MVKLIGEIDVAAYDDHGGVESVLINDDEWDEVLILDEGPGQELVEYVGDLVTLKGTLITLEDDDDFTHAVSVKSFEVELSEDDPDDDLRWLSAV